MLQKPLYDNQVNLSTLTVRITSNDLTNTNQFLWKEIIRNNFHEFQSIKTYPQHLTSEQINCSFALSYLLMQLLKTE